MAGEDFDKYDKILIAALVFMFVAIFGSLAYTSIDDSYMHGVCNTKGGFYIHTGLCIKKDALIEVNDD